MPRPLRAVCVYCGSSPGARPEYAAAARDLGRLLAGEGIGLVYGGGNVGLMGIVADAALAAGGEVVGVIPRHLANLELAHRGVTVLHEVATMHERKARMADLSDGFIALPGGIGTLEEIFEVCTWTQLGLHPKPCGFLNVAGFYNPVVNLLETMVTERFLRPEHREAILVSSSAIDLLERLRTFEPTTQGKWIDRPRTQLE